MARHAGSGGKSKPDKGRSWRKTALIVVGIGIYVVAALLLSARYYGPAFAALRSWLPSSGGDASSRPEQTASIVKDTEVEEVVPSLSGWVTDEDGTRYYDLDTHEACHGWLELDGERFYFDEETGLLHTGWLELDGRSYWLDDGERGTRGALVRGTWFDQDGKTYHLSEDGPADEGWCEIDGSTYCFDDVGAMRTGWADGNDGKRRWLKPENGTMATHEFVEIDGYWEPFDDDGSYVTYGEVRPPDEMGSSYWSARQWAVVNACDYTPWPGKALCAGWVSSVFVNAGEPAVGGDACDIANAWCVSNDLSYLQPGMVVAVPTHSRTENGKIWGHVGIYVGNGVIRDSGSYGIRRVRLGAWLAWFGVSVDPKWGWANGIALA